MIKAWSMSRLEVYESCPYRAKLQYIDRIPEAPRTISDIEHPLVRGLRVHKLAEDFVTKAIEFPEELCHFKDGFAAQRHAFVTAPNTCFVEQEWAITETWKTTGWFSEDAWARLKLDYAQVKGDEMDIVDYKTGKKYLLKHIPQGQFYGLISSVRFPDVKTFRIQFWYLDTGEVSEHVYSKLQLQVLKDSFDTRGRTMTTATDFPPRSSAYACRFCPYGEGKEGNSYCQYRYSNTN